jgi:hypothetical protein
MALPVAYFKTPEVIKKLRAACVFGFWCVCHTAHPELYALCPKKSKTKAALL